MNLKDYDDAELFDEEQAEEVYADEYEEEYEDIPRKRGKKKKGYGGFVVVVILLSSPFSQLWELRYICSSLQSSIRTV